MGRRGRAAWFPSSGWSSVLWSPGGALSRGLMALCDVQEGGSGSAMRESGNLAARRPWDWPQQEGFGLTWRTVCPPSEGLCMRAVLSVWRVSDKVTCPAFRPRIREEAGRCPRWRVPSSSSPRLQGGVGQSRAGSDLWVSSGSPTPASGSSRAGEGASPGALVPGA